MRATWRYVLIIGLAVLAGILQMTLLRSFVFLWPVELTLIGAGLFFVSGNRPAATVYAGLTGFVLDVVTGWRWPVHAVLGMAFVGLLWLLSRRLFSSQTWASMGANVLVASTSILVLRGWLVGYDSLSVAGQSATLMTTVPLIASRALLAAGLVGLYQVFRRSSYSIVREIRL